MNMSLILMLLILTTTMIGDRKDYQTESNCEKSFTCLRLLAAQGDVPPSFPSLIFLQEREPFIDDRPFLLLILLLLFSKTLCDDHSDSDGGCSGR